MNKQKICVFSVCFNEEDILPFYLDYYINFVKVDKIVIYDGGSTDNTHKIIKQYQQVELIIQKQDGQNDQYLKDTKNNSWKKYKNDYDWVIVCDIDEFLYHPNIQEKLFQYKKNGISIPITKGYDMITLNFPQFIKGNYLPNFITKGISDNHWMGKKIIFDPQKIEEINYRFGCHDCDPIGEIKYSDENELFMLHYKWLGHEYLTKRYKFLSDRRSEWNIQNGAGEHFITNSQITLNEYMKKYNSSTNVLKIAHFYENIDGWFDFKEFYTQMVNKFSSNSHFVEIGAWLGKSTSYMAVEIINSGKNIKFDVIDTWGGSKNFIDEDAYKIDGDPYEIFQQNLLSVKNYINPIKGSSDEIYKLYKDESLDFVFIDAGHDYISVMNDIKNWYPKVKKNGILAGHDYYVYPDVKKAVDEYFGNNIKLDDSLNESCGTWIVNLENFNKSNLLKIDNEILVDDLEQLKITQLNELENFMKIDKKLPYINDKKTIVIENISFQNGKVKMLLPYLIEKGYKIEQDDDNLILSINKSDDYYDIPLFSILTSCYKKYEDLKNAIESVIAQTYTNWEMLICSDGHDSKIENIINNYKSNKIKYFSTELINDYGSTQKNFLTKISKGKYLIYLDDDNIIYSNYLETIINNLDSNTGMIICHIDYDGLNNTLPVENKIILGKIDTLCLCVDKYYTKYAIWKNYAGQDYEFMKICENNIINDNKTVKFIPEILGRHIDKNKSKIISKDIIIMTAHPNYKTSEDITQQAIESLKPLNTDIILSCHSPMSLELQNAVKYVIFDKNNPIIKHDYYDHSWFDKKEFYAFINLHKNDNDLQHALAVYLNYYNGILHAKNLGYKTAICTNFDIIFDKDDLRIITEKIDEMNKTDKKSFFLTSNANEGIHYKTIFFITDVDFFIENFKYVINETDYNKLTRKVGSETNCLENFFYQTLKNSDKLLLQEINEIDFFSKSKVNLFSNIEYFTVLPERHKPDNFVIWFSSANSLDDNRNICISVTDNTDSIYLKNDIITKNYIFYKSFVFQKNHEYKISCQITYDNIIKEKVIIVNNQEFDKINENGDFWDKINYL